MFFGEVLIISHLRDKVGYLRTERPRDKLARDLAIFNSVVKQRCDDQIRVRAARSFRNQTCDFQEMINVRLLRRVFAALMNVPSRGCVGRLQNPDPFLHRKTL